MGNADGGWRGVISGLEALVGFKSIAVMMSTMMVDEWIPEDADASNFEHKALLGPVCRLGVFRHEWVSRLVACFRL